jgi:hypothetical protein
MTEWAGNFVTMMAEIYQMFTDSNVLLVIIAVSFNSVESPSKYDKYRNAGPIVDTNSFGSVCKRQTFSYMERSGVSDEIYNQRRYK